MVSNGPVSIAFAPHLRFVLVAAVLVGGAGCDGISGVGCNVTNTAAPEIATPLGYETVDVPLPGCAIPLPPVRAGIECDASEIGKSIDPKDVCHLLGALTRWVASGPADAPSVRPDDWSLVRAVCVRRLVRGTSARKQPRPPPLTFLQLEADVPNRSQRMTVQMSEQTRTLEYSVSPR